MSWMSRVVRSAMFCTAVMAVSSTASTAPPDGLADALIFHAGFDGTPDASRGADRRILTAETSKRDKVQPGNHRADVSILPGKGRYGDALRFSDVSEQVLYFHGSNTGYRKQDWSGTVSFWLRVDPDKGLKPGYCDPIQLTEKAWNDSGMWVDFDKDLPRAFRLGVFPRLSQWNPENTPWEQFPVERRPMVPVRKPAFNARLWTHVAFTFQDINATDGRDATASLYLHGIHQGTLKRPLQFDWDVDKAAIMLGLSYVGDFDDLAIFNRALSADEVEALRTLPHGAGGLVTP